MKPDRTYQYTPKYLGRYFDWVTGGTPGSFLSVNDSTWYEMPIRHIHKRNKNGVYDTGGEWLAYKRELAYEGDQTPIFRPGYGKAFEGPCRVLNPGPVGYSPTELLNLFEETKDKGAEAWNAMRPAQPSFNAALSLGELKDIPGTFKVRLKDLRRKNPKFKQKSFKGRSVANIIGDTYVAYMFGFLPLAKDIVSFIKVFNQRKKIFDQLLRDEGRPIKRGSKLSSPPDVEGQTVQQRTNSSSSHNYDIFPTFVSQCYTTLAAHRALCTTTIHTKYHYETWCSGKFRYHLPPGPRDGPWNKRLYRRILGLRFTPSTFYNLIPWSWFVDYFSDLGEFIDAISGGVEENYYAEYAYIMRTVTRTTTITCREVVRYNLAGHSAEKVCKLICTETVKIRVKATPFGFGLSESDLTNKQASILGALGLSSL